ncbi:MAG TPA: hypothetical protein VFF79_02395 [Conexibacter sp.]|jgi:hypothetical protein|nr:hypothetical protein [Conexibacter sp.]
MSRFFEELEERLRSSAAERAVRAQADAEAASSTPPRRAWPRRRRLLVVAAVTLAACAVPAVAAVTDLWRPDVKPASPMRTVATRPGRAISCDGHTPSRGPDVGPPVGPAFTSVLGVLARPRTSADAAFDRRILHVPHLIGIDVAGIRFLGRAADGAAAFVVAARGLGEPPWPERCLRELSPRERRRMEHPPLEHTPTICVFSGGGGCGPLAQIRAHGSYGTSGTVRGRATVTGLAPNGVRAVRVTYGRSTRDVPVRENFFSFRVAVDVEQASSPDRVEWLMDDGSVRDVTR